MKEKLKHFIFLFSITLFQACVTLFVPEGIETVGESLVVDGDIVLNDSTRIILSNSIRLDNDNKIAYVKDAQVWVENENGSQYPGTFRNSSNEAPYYAINTNDLDRNLNYKLCITLSDGSHYESDLLPVIISPEIDTISFFINKYTDKYNNIKRTASFYVNTHGSNETSRYYRWKYKEDWEYTSPAFTQYRYDPYTDALVQFPYEENTNYCWNKSASAAILIESTEQLNKNVVHQKVLTTIGSSDLRISYLYSIEVYQIAISDEAYRYWSTLEKNSDQIGGILGPQPSELYGNIRCISNPNKRALGYVTVGIPAVKRVFFPSSIINIYDHIPSLYCRFFDLERQGYLTNRQLDQAGYYVIALDLRDIKWGTKECVDCVTFGRGTKKKPLFWPNNDL